MRNVTPLKLEASAVVKTQRERRRVVYLCSKDTLTRGKDAARTPTCRVCVVKRHSHVDRRKTPLGGGGFFQTGVRRRKYK
jgi:hypothetical protein